MPIGFSRKETPFSFHNIQLQQDDMLYIFSDGFADQFGGRFGRKYLYKQFKNLIVSISSETVSKQKTMLKQEYQRWIGEKHSAMDDVLIMGVKIRDLKVK